MFSVFRLIKFTLFHSSSNLILRPLMFIWIWDVEKFLNLKQNLQLLHSLTSRIPRVVCMPLRRFYVMFLISIDSAPPLSVFYAVYFEFPLPHFFDRYFGGGSFGRVLGPPSSLACHLPLHFKSIGQFPDSMTHNCVATSLKIYTFK